MKTRVTITLDPEVHARAKAVARARHTTVSGMIEAFLRSSEAAGTENVRAQLRVLVKRILRKHGYPPDKQEQA